MARPSYSSTFVEARMSCGAYASLPLLEVEQVELALWALCDAFEDTDSRGLVYAAEDVRRVLGILTVGVERLHV